MIKLIKILNKQPGTEMHNNKINRKKTKNEGNQLEIWKEILEILNY